MINQLRLYDYDPALEEPFLRRFRDHVARIMAQYGFRILAMWTTQAENRNRFVYLLAWQDEAEMRERWAAFMADEEWSRIKIESRIETGREPVQAIEDIMLDAVAFSAPLGVEVDD